MNEKLKIAVIVLVIVVALAVVVGTAVKGCGGKTKDAPGTKLGDDEQGVDWNPNQTKAPQKGTTP